MRNNLSRESTACRWRIRGCGICFSGDLTCCCCFGVSVSLGHRWHCGLYLWQATYGRGLRQPAAIPSFQSPVSQFPSFPVSVKQVTSCQYGNYLQGASDPIGGRTGNSPLKLKGDLKYRSNTRRKRGPTHREYRINSHQSDQPSFSLKPCHTASQPSRFV